MIALIFKMYFLPVIRNKSRIDKSIIVFVHAPHIVIENESKKKKRFHIRLAFCFKSVRINLFYWILCRFYITVECSEIIVFVYINIKEFVYLFYSECQEKKIGEHLALGRVL